MVKLCKLLSEISGVEADKDIDAQGLTLLPGSDQSASPFSWTWLNTPPVVLVRGEEWGWSPFEGWNLTE